MSANKAKFTLHTEYKNFVPGVTTLNFMGAGGFAVAILLVIVIFVITLAVCVGAGVIVFNGYREDELFKHESHVIPGQITACEIATRSRGRKSTGTQYAIYTYTYEVEEILYEKTFNEIKSRRPCADYPPGTVIHVRYVYSDPRLSRVLYLQYPQEGEFNILLIVVLGSSVLVGLSVYTLYGLIRGRAIERRLKRSITLLKGTVISIKGHTFKSRWGSIEVYSVEVKYQFTSPLGPTITGVTRNVRQDLKDATLPHVGTPVVILYADDSAHMAL